MCFLTYSVEAPRIGLSMKRSGHRKFRLGDDAGGGLSDCRRAAPAFRDVAEQGEAGPDAAVMRAD